MNPQLWWYLSRASGIVAYVLLVAGVIWGVLLSTRALKPLDRPAWLLAVHRFLAALAVVCTGLHLGALVADGYVHFAWKEILVPGASAWRTSAVAVGVVALYLFAAVELTSLMMRKLPKRLWRAIHMSSYALVWTISVHAAMAGSDVSNVAYQAMALLLTVAATTAAVLRVLAGRRGRATSRACPAPAPTPARSLPRRFAPAAPASGAGHAGTHP
jgi:predicted ferric reductase